MNRDIKGREVALAMQFYSGDIMYDFEKSVCNLELNMFGNKTK